MTELRGTKKTPVVSRCLQNARLAAPSLTGDVAQHAGPVSLTFHPSSR